MHRYRGFSLNIESELELPGLPPSTGEPNVVIQLGDVPRATPSVTPGEHLGFHEMAGMFRIRGGREIVIDPLPGVDDEILKVLVMGRFMAFLLRQRGWLPLHASGVAKSGQAILFLGASGIGKSTLAAAFHAAGYQVITDDVAAVRPAAGPWAEVLPAGGGRVRLAESAPEVLARSAARSNRRQSSGSDQHLPEDLCMPGARCMPEGRRLWDKFMFELDNAASDAMCEPLPVRRIYAVELPAPGDHIRIETIDSASAVPLLSAHSFAKHRRMDRPAWEAHLRDCAAVAMLAGVARLRRGATLADLPHLVSVIEEDLATL